MPEASPSRLDRIGASAAFGAVVVGGAGLLSGFIGPMLLNPDANQGPMLGLFISGPIGVIIGAVLGTLLGTFTEDAAAARKGVISAAILVACGALVASLPEAQFRNNLVAYEVVKCQPPSELKEEAFADWEKEVARVTWAKPRPGWKEGFDAMAAADPGVVVTVKITRSAAVYENRKPWNRGTFQALPARDVAKRYYLRKEDCAHQLPGASGAGLAQGATSREWPAETLPNFLGLTTLEPIPNEMRTLL